ncbi:hypothetical protein HID58_095258 [Brassica napus]|uniref:Uncharacterized protein n=1 Tax=Brassica napus TaxID=3708 RepID=A0ABQ7X6N7_BRANA|nr:hypothetical protein HID58_095258 [Brassica napus]
MKVLKNEKHRGYTPLYDQIPDPENQVQGDHKEGYYMDPKFPEMILSGIGHSMASTLGLILMFCLGGERQWRNTIKKH